MAADEQRFADTMELPPATEQPNVYPLSWQANTRKMQEVWAAAQRETWDPAKLPWDSFNPDSYSWEAREAIAYWWTLLSVFDASAPPVFAAAMIKTYEAHEEAPVRNCFFSVTRDEHNHETMCGMAITRLLAHPDPLSYTPKTDLGRRLQKNAAWLYFNGGRYWEGYKKAVPRYSLAVLFSSFLMGEIAAATIFKHMYDNSREAVFKEGFRNIGRDEGRHMAICMALMQRDYPRLGEEDKQTVTRQIRAGYLFLSAVLFEPPMDFWDLPADFIANQHQGEDVCRQAGFGVPAYAMKLQNWKNAMLNLKSVLDQYGIEFPAIPEVGITGREVSDVEMDDIIPVF